MFKKFLASVFIIVVLHLAYAPSIAARTVAAEKEAILAEKVKAGITKLGVGKDSRVELKLKDKRKVKGYISEIADTHFVVTDDQRNSTPVAYPQVKTAKGNNLSGKAIAIGLVAGAVFIIIAAALLSKS